MKNKEKESVVIVYTGEGKGKTSAAIGQTARALGFGYSVAFIQFIKEWEVSEHKFFKDIKSVYDDEKFTFYKGGRGFYCAREQSAKGVSDDEHIAAARQTFDFAFEAACSGKYDLVVADEINNAVLDKMITVDDLKKLIDKRAKKTSLCLTGRGFPQELEDYIDIITVMKDEKHYFCDGYLAKEGIEY